MNNKDKQILLKIHQHLTAVLSYCKGCDSLDAFQQNTMRVEACVFNLMQIGELAKTSLSDAAKSEINTIPWKQLYGMRNRIVHGYSGVDMRIVWDTIFLDLPQLQREIQQYLN